MKLEEKTTIIRITTWRPLRSWRPLRGNYRGKRFRVCRKKTAAPAVICILVQPLIAD